MENWAVQKLFPGLRGWLPSSVAQCLRDELHMPAQLNSLTTAGPAAQFRTAVAGGDRRPSMKVAGQVARITAAGRSSEQWDLVWRWSEWFDNGPAHRLLRNQAALVALVFGLRQVWS